MLHMFLPFDQHFDSGFGAVADSFRYSADALADTPGGIGLNSHLPISFLYRHAIELYLKSGIILLHRKFAVPYGDTPSDGEPSVMVGQKREPLHRVHSLAPLYTEFCALLADLAESLSQVPETKPEYWVMTTELDEWIEAIEATDKSSTFFRYPVTKDAERDSQKSTIRRDDIESMTQRMHDDGPAVKAMLILNDAGEAVEAYSHDDTQNKEVIATLRQAAEMLYNMRAMMSYTLVGGR
ncbi:hypothetical protein [Pseudomonas sp. Irchel 3H7]|uniref:hypothetical protein n=1 Tax=Pseudomonas sp. Irchel 3H7 TaxID=2009042 RepID=UPI000BA43A17|nr:hypothetical protein [Pseudomonas sp. Irchel 3H7]